MGGGQGCHKCLDLCYYSVIPYIILVSVQVNIFLLEVRGEVHVFQVLHPQAPEHVPDKVKVGQTGQLLYHHAQQEVADVAVDLLCTWWEDL